MRLEKYGILIPYSGKGWSHLTLGNYTVENVCERPKHPNFDNWLANLKQGALFRQSANPNINQLINTPYPDLANCQIANDIADERLEVTGNANRLEELRIIKEARTLWSQTFTETILQIKLE